jgi:hypothetical protein
MQTTRQSRWESPVLRTGIVSILIFFLKEYFELDIPIDFINMLVDVVLGLVIPIVAAYNNPTRKDKL